MVAAPSDEETAKPAPVIVGTGFVAEMESGDSTRGLAQNQAPDSPAFLMASTCAMLVL